MHVSQLMILANPFHKTESVRNLGVWFDSDFFFSKHIQNVCKGCFSQLSHFRNIRQFLTQDAVVSVASAFVSSHFDYCNSLFRSLSKVNLHRLQSTQNSAAKIVTNIVEIHSDNSGTQETPLAPYSVLFNVQTGYPGVQVYSYWFP